MPGTASQKFRFSELARATQASLDWKSWGQPAARRAPERVAPSGEVLDKLIEAEIIPRLMLNARGSADALTARVHTDSAPRVFDSAEIDAFAQAAVSSDPDTLLAEVNRLLDDGVTHEDLLLKLLAPAARRLGQYWEDDTCDFGDVTIGLMKLHRVLECVNADTPSGMGVGGSSPRILLSAAPGEQHVFGVVMVGEFFARSGWRVRCESNAALDHLVATVCEDHYDVVGFSASADVNIDHLQDAIRTVRTASCNKDVLIMVGGQMFNADMSLARRIGADATATDGVRAVVTAERMVQRLARAEAPPQ